MTEQATTQPPYHKYFESQFDDEDVLYVFRRHPLIMRKGLIISLSSWLIGPLIILALTYIMPNNPPTMVAFFLAVFASIAFGSVLLLPWWISWYFSVFIVTNQRFVQITQKACSIPVLPTFPYPRFSRLTTKLQESKRRCSGLVQ